MAYRTKNKLFAWLYWHVPVLHFEWLFKLGYEHYDIDWEQ